jgi:DNA-nicking Smr family endonuclease
MMAMRKNRHNRAAGRDRLSEDDVALWRHATRADVRLPGRDYDETDFAAEIDSVPERPPSTKARPVKPSPTRSATTAASLAPLQIGRADGLDKRTAQRLRRGQVQIEARLDLHGLTQAEAHHALNGFLVDAQAAGKRSVLVITGKGRAEQGYGVLRRAVPHWLNLPHNRSRIIAVHTAQPRHGGSGALYVLLRKRR